MSNMERTEPKNAYLFNEYSKIFSRLVSDYIFVVNLS